MKQNTAKKTKGVGVPEISQKDSEWLIGLRERLWKKPAGAYQMSWPQGSLVDKEVKRLKRLIKEHDLPCTLGGGQFGSIGIAIYSHPEAPGMDPTFCAMVWEDHIGDLKNDHSRGAGNVGEKAWRFFATNIVNKPRNLELLKLYGLEPPEGIENYDH